MIKSHTFDTAPGPLVANPDRIAGMLLGLAIGDALGNTTEGMLPAARRHVYGEIINYTHGAGRPSDDTQLAFWLLDQINQDGGFVPDNVAQRYASNQIYGIGSTTRRALDNYRRGVPWYKAGVASLGNGALMRIAPILVPHLRTGGAGLWSDTAQAVMLTHNHPTNIATCLAWVAMLWQLLAMAEPPPPEWYLDTYVAAAMQVEGHGASPRGGRYRDYHGPLWHYALRYVDEAYAAGVPVVHACNRWHSGAYLYETVPSVLYILMRHGREPVEAICRAVNDTKDNDTVAAIVGAALGALHGRVWLQHWVDNLLGRTMASDDGAVFRIIEEALEVWT